MRHPDIWRNLTPGWRLAIWLGTSWVLMALWGVYFWSGPWQVEKEARAQAQRQQASLTAQRRQLWVRQQVLPPERVNDTRQASPFSALHFQSSVAALVSWQPDEKGGVLVLDTSWSPLPALFEQLAEREMMPVAFAIEPVGSLLRLTLHLEAFNAR